MRTTLLTALLSLAACGTGSETDLEVEALKRARTSTATAPTYAERTTNSPSTSPTWMTSFPISSTGSVYFATDIDGTLSGQHQLALFINMPDGSAYQRIDVSFATDVVAGVGQQQAEKTSTGWRVWAAIPVAGTVIQAANIAGQWTAQAWVDSASAANASTSFNLQ